MPTSKTSLDFRLLVVRVLPGCVQHIRKCLVENHFYYLNNNYRISEDGNLITRQICNTSSVVLLSKTAALDSIIKPLDRAR